MVYSVTVKTDCPHVEGLPTVQFDQIEKIDVSTLGCNSCGEKNENWVCLSCFHIGCSNYMNGHMADHGKNANHNVVLGMNDLSVWCYKCDSYISHPSLKPNLHNFYKLKFGESPTTV